MSYLWGIGELVEDPSADLVRVLKEFLSKNQVNKEAVNNSEINIGYVDGPTTFPKPNSEDSSLNGFTSLDSPGTSTSYLSTRSNDKTTIKTKVYKDINARVMESPNTRVTVSCTKEVRKEKKYRSKHVQTEIAFAERRQRAASAQCEATPLSMRCAGTTPRPLQQLQRGTDPLPRHCTHAATSADQHLLCKRHLKALNSLKQIQKNTLEYETTLFQRIKAGVYKIASLLNAEKIQSIPDYDPFARETTVLYRCASIEKLASVIKKEQMQQKPKKGCLKTKQ